MSEILSHLIIKVSTEGAEKANNDLKRLTSSNEDLDKSIQRAADKARLAWDKLKAAQTASLLRHNENLDNIFKRNSQSFIATEQKKTESLEVLFKRQTQSFIAEQQKEVEALKKAEEKKAEIRQNAIDKARLDNRFSGAAGGWGGGGKGGGLVNGVPINPSGPSRYSLAPEVTGASIISNVGTLGAAVGIGIGASSLMNTIVEMETLNARLISVTGSVKEADSAFNTLKILDRQLPHTISELTNTFSLLIHNGFIPSEEALRSMSAIASASGQDIYDTVVTMQRATEGEFRNLKKYGISAEKFGDQVTFSFNGVKKTVDNNKIAIQEYFTTLGKSGTFAEASANKMNTLAGSISNLESAWMSFVNGSSQGAGISSVLSASIKLITMALDGFDIIIGGLVRKIERVGTIIGHISNGDFKKAAEEMANQAKHLAMPLLDAADYADENESKRTDLARFVDKNVKLGIEAEKEAKRIKELQDVRELTASREDKLSMDMMEKRKIFDENTARIQAEGVRTNQTMLVEQVANREWYDSEIARLRKTYEEPELAKKKKDQEDEAFILKNRIKAEDEANQFFIGIAEYNAKQETDLAKLAKKKNDILFDSYQKDQSNLKDSFKANLISLNDYFNQSKELREQYEKEAGNISVNGVPLPQTPRSKRSDALVGLDSSPATYSEDQKTIETRYANMRRVVAEQQDLGEAARAEKNNIINLKERSEYYARQDQEIAELERFHNDRNREIEEQRKSEELSLFEYHSRLAAEHERYQNQVSNISTEGARKIAMANLQTQSQVLGLAGGIAAQMDQLAQGSSDSAKATFIAIKSIAIAKAIVDTIAGSTAALAMGPFGIPMSTYIMGFGMSQVALMAATSVQEYGGKFAQGGIVPGSSFSGDNVSAHVNSGEMILNHGQQANMFKMLNNGSGSSGSSKVVVNVMNYAGVEVETKERDMEGTKVVDLIIRKIKADLVRDANENGDHTKALARNFQLTRRGVA